MVSPPGSPEVVRKSRPQSMMYSSVSAETTTKSRPQSMMFKPAPRSGSRMSVSSKHGGSRGSDEDAKTSVRVGKYRNTLSRSLHKSLTIKPAVRVRPPLKSTDPGFDLIPQRFQRSMVHVSGNTTLAVESTNPSTMSRKVFIFDRVFGEKVDQRGVYDYLQESVDSFLQGYNVSILAYGQSGAGKSYTMGTSGPREQNHEETKGVIPRAAAHLFDHLDGEKDATNRPQSGLKSPTRYSVGNINTILQNGLTNGGHVKPNGDKDWELSATYVEVCCLY